VCAAVIVVLSLVALAPAQEQDREEQERVTSGGPIQEAHHVLGQSRRQDNAVRVVQLSDVPQVHLAGAVTVKRSADTGASLVLQSWQGPVDSNPPDPAITVGPNQVIATVNSTMVIYDKKGTVLSTNLIATFMGQPNANVWDTHLYYDANSGHFFVVCVTGDQRTTGFMLLAVSATNDATGAWYIYQLKEAKNAWLDFPWQTVTSNALVLSFMDIAAQGSTQTTFCATEVIGLPELISGNQSLKITRFDHVFSGPGFCNFAYPAINYDQGNIAYLLTQSNGVGDSLELARIDTSGTPTLDVFNMAVPHFGFPNTVPQKGTSQGIFPGGPGISGSALRNGSLWVAHTAVASDGNSVARWYEIDPVSRTVKQVGDVAGLGGAWMPVIAVLPDNEVDLVYTTSSSNDFASAGFAHRSSSDAPNTMPVTGVYQAGAGSYTGTRWGDFYEAWADPDGQSAWGIAEYIAANSYGTAIVHLASAGAVTVTPLITLAVSPTSATVNAGDSAKFTLSVTAQNAGAIAFSCAGLPTGATCSFNPASLNGSGNVELTIATAKTSAALISAGELMALTVALLMGLVLAPGLRRRTRYLALVMVACALATFVACGGTASTSNSQPMPQPPTTTPTPPTPPTPPATPAPTPSTQTFAVTITATGTGANGSATVSLTVK